MVAIVTPIGKIAFCEIALGENSLYVSYGFQLYAHLIYGLQLYAHLPLIMNEDGTKLSKRQSDIHVEHYKSEGYYPEAVLNFVTLSGGAFKDRDQVTML
jgi:glutamyl/glutaminyl-tRNA synthetase